MSTVATYLGEEALRLGQDACRFRSYPPLKIIQHGPQQKIRRCPSHQSCEPNTSTECWPRYIKQNEPSLLRVSVSSCLLVRCSAVLRRTSSVVYHSCSWCLQSGRALRASSRILLSGSYRLLASTLGQLGLASKLSRVKQFCVT